MVSSGRTGLAITRVWPDCGKTAVPSDSVVVGLTGLSGVADGGRFEAVTVGALPITVVAPSVPTLSVSGVSPLPCGSRDN